MKYFGKKLVIAVAGTAVLAASVMGCASKLENTEVVVTVGKEEIPAGVANFYARFQQAQYETYYSSFMGEDMWSKEVEDGVTYEESTKESLLELLENMYLLEAHAAEYEVELSEEELSKIEKAADKFVEDNVLEDKAIVSGDKEYVQRVLELLTIQSKMEAPMKEGVDQEVSDEEAAQKSMEYVLFSYSNTDEEGNTVNLTDEEKTELQETAQKFVDKIKEDKSTDLKAAAEAAGYELQTATFDGESTNPSADVVAAADALKEGELTDLIVTDYGCYVAKVTSMLDREATDAKKKEIIDEREQKQYDDLLETWRKDTEITVDKKVWNKISFEKQGVTMKQEEEEPYAVNSDNADESETE